MPAPTPAQLQQLHAMLEAACCSADTATQQRVYAQLSEAQEHPEFFLGLATLARDLSLQHQVRVMAMLTLKSALKRKHDEIDFSEEDLGYIRECVINGDYSQSEPMLKTQKSLISLLALWNRSVDYRILDHIVKNLSSESKESRVWGFEALFVIFEDIKFETENLSCLQQPEFAAFITTFFQIFAATMGQQDLQLAHKSISCTNLLLKYTRALPNPTQVLTDYLTTYLVPLVTCSNERVKQSALDGIIEVAENDARVIMEYTNSLEAILTMPLENATITKKYLSLLLQLVEIDTEQQQRLLKFLPLLVPILVRSLAFTKEDELNLKMEIQQQNNPYNYEQDDEAEQENEQRGNQWGYTRRKLSVLVLERVAVQYTEAMWAVVQPYLLQLLGSQDVAQREVGTLMVGVVFERMQDHLEFLEHAIPLLISEVSSEGRPDILRCTSLWSLGKLAHLIARESSLSDQIQRVLLSALETGSNQVRDAAFSTLDELICNLEQLPQTLPEIVLCLRKGIQNCQGKPLYSVLKTCSTLYERYFDKIPPETTHLMVQELCLKWSLHAGVESIMSPILECLVAIASSNKAIFATYGFQIFQQAFKTLHNVHQKTVILRAIDLISTIVAIEIPEVTGTIASSAEVHAKIHSMLVEEEAEIRNFTYGLLGDICKATGIGSFAEAHIQTIGNRIAGAKLTECSNGLTCLTDLIVRHPELGPKYARGVMELALSKLGTNNVPQVYSFNFARIFCRLGAVSPQDGSLFVREHLPRLCSGLRAHEHQKLTDQSYRGLFAIISCAPGQVAESFHCLVESFICYPCEDKEVQDTFVRLLKSFRQSLTAAQWESFMGSSAFLPAVRRKVQALCL